MAQTTPHGPDKRTEMARRMKRARSNSLRNAQVMPPHNVDLTLPPAVHDDIHVPAHVGGSDLSKGGPEASSGNAATKPVAKPVRGS